MFLPQAITAVGSSLLQGSLSHRLSGKPVYLAGLCANLAAMILLIASRFVMGSQPAAYPLLLLATAGLGVGFGLTVPSINTFTAAFHPDAVDRSVLVLNSLLGRRAAIPARLLAVRGVRSDVRVLRDHERELVAARPDLAKNSITVASLALTVFWAMVTAGRLLFAVIQRRFPSRLAYHLLPFVLAGAFVLISVLPSRAPVAGVLAFALAGFGCSAMLPLTISFGQERLVGMSASMAGLVIAFYQLGYGLAAFGVGPLRQAGLTLPGLYGVSAVVAAALGLLSLAVAHGRPSPRSVHPRPQPLSAPQPAPELIS